jgi:hypothetical protein
VRVVTIAGILVLLCAASIRAQPQSFELSLVEIFEAVEPEYIFVIGQTGFRSVESLKQFLSSLEPGSELKWNPGCLRNGKEPLLNSEKDLSEFRAFLAGRGVKFVLVKAG